MAGERYAFNHHRLRRLLKVNHIAVRYAGERVAVPKFGAVRSHRRRLQTPRKEVEA
jgi:hypothetical protein